MNYGMSVRFLATRIFHRNEYLSASSNYRSLGTDFLLDTPNHVVSIPPQLTLHPTASRLPMRACLSRYRQTFDANDFDTCQRKDKSTTTISLAGVSSVLCPLPTSPMSCWLLNPAKTRQSSVPTFLPPVRDSCILCSCIWSTISSIKHRRKRATIHVAHIDTHIRNL